jgi:peptidoglycan pentaglycine glycine transferase (the first glycine)
VTPEISPERWKTFLTNHPNAHLLQSCDWGELKAAFGWDVVRIQDGPCGAQILFRRLPFGFSLAYIPKGPLGPWLPDFLPAIDKVCQQKRAFALKIEPDEGNNPELAEELQSHGFLPSKHTIQPRRTLVVDLEGEEEELLARMHQKTRYNVRLAERKGVHVSSWQDLEAFGKMMRETAQRDSFGAHMPSYYKCAYDLFHPSGACELFVAEYDGMPLAALMAFTNGSRAWYFYGASTSLERNRMPTYLLQWEAMKWARERGCREYDLWGVPDEEHQILEEEFPKRKDDLWGVYRFKRGFGGNLIRSIGTWDRPYIRPIFHLYRNLISILRK